MKIDKKKWLEETKWEKNWWGNCANTFREEEKQLVYISHMGLDKYKINSSTKKEKTWDLQGKSILDVGGGPISFLLKCTNFKHAVVIDPCDYPKWVEDRYKAHGIELIKKPAEEVNITQKEFDEVWIYNVLQHTMDPEKIISYIKKAGKLVRLFEWVDTKINPGHPHSFTREFYDKHFPNQGGRVVKIVYPGEEGKYYNPAYCVTYVTRKVNEEPKKEKKLVFPKKKRFHLLGVAHLATNRKEAIACAYSQKVYKMAQMLKSLGHTVYFYGVEGSTVKCDEFVQVSTQEVLKKTYGGYDSKKKTYRHNPKDLAYRTFNENAIREINKRKKEGDYLLISMGNYQKPIADAVRIGLTTEMGIGYTGVFAKYRVFESYSWMMHVYGLNRQRDGSFYDCVIQNYFDPKDFKFQEKKEGYFLYLGRLVPRKGVVIAKQTIEAIDGKLLLAGQKGEGVDYVDINSPNCKYVGFADIKKRRKLLAGAKALFLPTIYIEPFGGVIIEAAFSGTPVITTDWGVFGENVLHGKTGYRCRTLEQFMWAAKNIHKIKPEDCYSFAMKNFTMARVAKKYEEYFNMLRGLYGKGWYEPNPKRKELDWLKRY